MNFSKRWDNTIQPNHLLILSQDAAQYETLVKDTLHTFVCLPICRALSNKEVSEDCMLRLSRFK